MHHLQKKRADMFFVKNNPTIQAEIIKTKTMFDDDGNNLLLIKSLSQKYEPRQFQKNTNILSRLDNLIQVRTSINDIAQDELIEMCILSPSSFDFAVLLYKLYGKIYRCTNIVNQTWEKYVNGEWIDAPRTVNDLRSLLSNELTEYFNRKLASLNALINNTTLSGDFITPLTYKKQNLDYIISRLSTITMKNLILKDASEIFYHSDIFHA
jgi:hypothetical protein